MNKLIVLMVAMLWATHIKAQRGGRIGLISGVAKTALQNANDNAMSDSALRLLPTYRWHNGLELGYFGRFFGVSAQLLVAPIAQNYRSELYGMNAKTNITYFRSSLLFNYTTNQKKQVRLVAYTGIGHGMNVYSKDVVQFTNPINDSFHTLMITNKDYYYNDTVTVKSTLSEGIYHPYDVSFIIGAGLDYRINSNWLVNTSIRFEKGLVGVDNNRKTTRSTTNIETNTTTTEAYDHWGYLRSKYIPDYANKIRSLTNTQSMGLYLSLKYLLVSQKVKEYELYY